MMVYSYNGLLLKNKKRTNYWYMQQHGWMSWTMKRRGETQKSICCMIPSLWSSKSKYGDRGQKSGYLPVWGFGCVCVGWMILIGIKEPSRLMEMLCILIWLIDVWNAQLIHWVIPLRFVHFAIRKLYFNFFYKKAKINQGIEQHICYMVEWIV